MWSKIISFFMSIIMAFLGFFGLGNGKTDKPSDGGVKIAFEQNIQYANGSRNVFDFAFPESAKGDTGLVLAIHGGAWVAGSKENETDVIKACAEKGYAAAAINYTYISETVHCDTLLNEITLALKAIKSHAAQKGINISRVILRGESAGAHLAMLYAYTKAAEAKSIAGIDIKAVFDYCGPTSLDKVDMVGNLLLTNFGTVGIATVLSNLCGVTVNVDNCSDKDVKAALAAVSPACFTSTAVPTVICHGVADVLVPYLNAVMLDSALTADGVKHTLISFPTSGHLLENDADKMEQANKLFDEYCKEYLN
ncbi:MAG: alpha/beta hydrolase [Clostridia bacterium]|nr:alpha/beta hydrolase [Clostridia bacterium]